MCCQVFERGLRELHLALQCCAGAVHLASPDYLERSHCLGGITPWFLAFCLTSASDETFGCRKLGAGTALPSFLVAKLGASVVITDKPENTVVLESYTQVMELNGVQSRVSVVPLKWGHFDASFFGLPKLDAVIAADCFYDPKDFDDILATMNALFEANPGCKFVTVYQERRYTPCFSFVHRRLDQLNR